MSLNDSDLLVIGRGNKTYKLEVGALTTHQKATFVEVDGDTMVGPLKTLPPNAGADAANKTYVDTEIQKVVDQLDDIVSQRTEGSFSYKAPGFNGSNPRPPGNGEFYLYRNQNLDYTPNYEIADRLILSHTTLAGDINNHNDLKVGEYLQFNIAGTANSFTYIVDTINHNVGYSEFNVTFNRKSSAAVIKPVDGEVSRVQSYHIEGIDIDDLNANLDERYVSTNGDVVSGSIALGDATLRAGTGTLKVLLDGPNGIIRSLGYNETGFVDLTSNTENGVRMLPAGEVIVQRELGSNSKVLDVRDGNNSTLSISSDGMLVTQSKIEMASTQETDGPQTVATKDYVDALETDLDLESYPELP